MTDAPVRFLLTCPARTGSTMLISYLQTHPHICAHGEVLAPRGPLNFYGINYQMDPPLEGVLMSIRDRDPVAFLHDFVWQPGDRRAVGFKGKYEELLHPRYPAVLQNLQEDTGIRVVHLFRENLLARYLSQRLAQQRGFYNLQDDRELPPDRVPLSPRECEEDFARTEHRRGRFRRLLADHEVHEVTYEDLVGSGTEALGRVQDFLGVEPRELTTPTRRLNPGTLRDSIENFDELAAHFVGTRYEAFFQD